MKNRRRKYVLPDFRSEDKNNVTAVIRFTRDKPVSHGRICSLRSRNSVFNTLIMAPRTSVSSDSRKMSGRLVGDIC